MSCSQPHLVQQDFPHGSDSFDLTAVRLLDSDIEGTGKPLEKRIRDCSGVARKIDLENKADSSLT